MYYNGCFLIFTYRDQNSKRIFVNIETTFFFGAKHRDKFNRVFTFQNNSTKIQPKREYKKREKKEEIKCY